MAVHGIVPNLPVASRSIDRDFYTGFLSLTPTFERGDVAGFKSSARPAAQVHLMAAATGTEPDYPVISIQVSDVEAAYVDAQRRGYEITYPLTRESFGPHHFYVKTPGGTLVNIIEHD
jgi:catechol 2,3-dioxygenase-like lactoylglutathione lyase family enzyme